MAIAALTIDNDIVVIVIRITGVGFRLSPFSKSHPYHESILPRTLFYAQIGLKIQFQANTVERIFRLRSLRHPEGTLK